MADSRQYWMDQVLRQVAEENMNPDDRSLGMRRALTAEEEAMSQAVLAEREEPYMGNLGRAIGAIRDFTFPSGPQVPLAGIRGVTPTVGAGDLPNVAKDMALPLLASDLGVAGAMANVPIPFPGMGKKPVQAGAKKFVPRKKPYKSKTDPIAEATSRISDDYQFLDSTSKGKVARAGLSKERYQQLLDDGYDFDRIMKEHPRLSPEEWVDIEDVAGRPETFKTSTAPKDLTEVEFKKMQNIDTELLEEDLNFERIAELVGWKGKVNTATHLDILKIANKELDELMDIRRKFVDKTKDPRNPLDLELPDDSSLDFTGVKGAKAQGQCYPYCYRKAFEKDETIKIVHGQVDNGLGELTPHAWIETKDGLVLDWQTMEGPKEILEQLSSMGSPVITSRLKHYGKGIPVKEFDKFFKPVRDLEFTPEEMRKLTSGTRSSGPFTVEEISRILGK